MFATKHEPDALDLSTRRQASPSLEQADDEDENYSLEDGSHPKKTTYDSGFVDTSDENNSSIMVKQERQHHHHYHSTPLRAQQIHKHVRHPSTSSSACSSPTRQEELNDKDCRNTRFLGSRAVAVLNHWFQLNRDYPYPDDERTERLADEAGITQKQVKKWFANKRVRSQICYKPLYRSRKCHNTPSMPVRPPQTNYNYIINHNNIAASGPPSLPHFPPTNPVLFNPMATSMMMFMMQQQMMSNMMAATGSPFPQAPKPTPSGSTGRATSEKPTVDRITRFWL